MAKHEPLKRLPALRCPALERRGTRRAPEPFTWQPGHTAYAPSPLAHPQTLSHTLMPSRPPDPQAL
eukprot:365694-Chlamydomonas_euryale.AAC.1